MKKLLGELLALGVPYPVNFIRYVDLRRITAKTRILFICLDNLEEPNLNAENC